MGCRTGGLLLLEDIGNVRLFNQPERNMKEAIKDEALEQIEKDVLCGFETEEEIFTGVREMFYDEDDFDEEWLKQAIAEKYDRHQKNSSGWARPTDFERLAVAFDALVQDKIVCLHKAGYTRQDGEGDCEETIETLNKLGINAIGYCFYHTQDLERAIDPGTGNLFLGFDSSPQDDDEAIVIANKIIDKLKENGFQVNWPGTVDQRIEIQNIHWQKIPDDQNWGAERVVQILAPSSPARKPFWKFW